MWRHPRTRSLYVFLSNTKARLDPDTMASLPRKDPPAPIFNLQLLLCLDNTEIITSFDFSLLTSQSIMLLTPRVPLIKYCVKNFCFDCFFPRNTRLRCVFNLSNFVNPIQFVNNYMTNHFVIFFN